MNNNENTQNDLILITGFLIMMALIIIALHWLYYVPEGNVGLTRNKTKINVYKPGYHISFRRFIVCPLSNELNFADYETGRYSQRASIENYTKDGYWIKLQFKLKYSFTFEQMSKLLKAKHGHFPKEEIERQTRLAANRMITQHDESFFADAMNYEQYLHHIVQKAQISLRTQKIIFNTFECERYDKTRLPVVMLDVKRKEK